MTPEEQLRRFNDASEWSARLSARPDAFPARRRMSPVLVSVATVASVAIVGVVVFSVFGLGIRSARPVGSPAAPTQSASPNPTPSVTPTERTPPIVYLEKTDATAPATQFGGDCSQIFSNARASQIVGTPVTLQKYAANTFSGGGVNDGEFALRQNAGLRCVWMPDGSNNSNARRIQLDVFPADALPTIPAATCGAGLGESTYGTDFCRIEHAVNGYRISGGVVAATKVTTAAAAQSVIAGFDLAAARTPVVEPPTAAGRWSTIQSCTALAKTFDVDGALGANSTFGSTGLGAGRYGNLAMESLLWDMGLWTACGAQAGNELDASGLYRFGRIGIYAGGSWLNNKLVATDAISTAVPGFDRAAIREHRGIQTLFVFRGTNVLTYQGNLGDDLTAAYPLLDALADALDTQ